MLDADSALPTNDKSIDGAIANIDSRIMPKAPTHNMFLEGNFAPIHEEFTLTQNSDFEIRGKIPRDLNGAFYRNGPNPQNPPGSNYHWFFGDGMVHAFQINRGNVTYRNRYVRTPTYTIEKRAKRDLFLGGGFHPLAQLSLIGGNMFSLLGGLVSQGNADVYTKLIAKANTAIMSFRDEVFALVESSPPTRIDPFTLDTIGLETFGSGFVAPFTAHPRIDPHTGYLYAFGYRVAGKPKLEYFAINPSGKLVSRTPVEIPYAAMIHDFVITRNYAVLPVFPAVASLSSLRRGRIAEWKPGEGAFVYVVNKNGEKESIRKFDMPLCFVYHYANAFEDGKTIVIDAVKYDSLPLMGSDADSRAELFERKNNGILTRFRLDLQSGKVEETVLSHEYYAEFPVIDPRLTGEKYEHVFTGTARGTTSGGFFDCQAAFHITRGKVRTEISEFPSGHFGGEPIFVPTGKAGQAKGYLLNLIYDSTSDRSYLAVYDAERIDKKPVCEIGVPHRIPYGFHGLWRQSRS